MAKSRKRKNVAILVISWYTGHGRNIDQRTFIHRDKRNVGPRSAATTTLDERGHFLLPLETCTVMPICSMDRFLLSAICLLMAVFSRGVDGTAFVFDNMTCDSPVNLYIESVTCGSSSSDRCTFGDVLHATGTLGLSSSLTYSSMCSTVKARFLNSTVLSQTYDVPIDVCDDLGLKSMDGTACPGAADYYFDTKFQLPGQGSYTLGSGMYL